MISLIMCFCLIPASVFADEDQPAASENDLLIAPAEGDGTEDQADLTELIEFIDQLINPGPEPYVSMWTSEEVYVLGREGQEYVIAKKGEEPDWTKAVQPDEYGGVYFEGLEAATEYIVYTRVIKTEEASDDVIYQTPVMTSLHSTAIIGEAVVGKEITVEIDPPGIEGLEVRWYHETVNRIDENSVEYERTPIEGAVGGTYVPKESDLGKLLSVVVTKGDTELMTMDEIGPVIPGFEVFFMLDAEDEEPYKTMYTGEGDRLAELPVPEKEGFTFEGWYDWDGVKVTEDTVYEWSTSVFAQWIGPDGEITGGAPVYEPFMFDDVTEEDYFYGPVRWALDNNVTEGTTFETFSPYKECTRAQMVTFLWRMAGCPAVDPTTMFFDIDPNAYYVEAISWAFNNGIVEGVEPHTFAPNNIVTRAQAVTMLCRYANGAASGENPFGDVAEGSWYYEPVLWAAANGITEGTSEGRFSPSKPCTRAQIVTFLSRYAQGAGSSEEPKGGEGEPSPVTGDLALIHEPEFGGIYITKTINEFNAMGFEYGDSVDVIFSSGYSLIDVPYYNGYYTDNGEPLLIAYPGYDYIKACINNGDDLWAVAEIEEGDTAGIVLREKGKYLDIQKARDIHYTDARDDYASDEIFANFRALTGGSMGEGTVYRSASPCDDQHNRASYVDRLMTEKGVKYIVDLADTDEKIKGYLASEGFDSPGFKALYEDGKVLPVGLNMNFKSDEFRSKLAAALTAMSENEGPFLIHCTEGKDRTGFVCMVLEALEGASYEELVKDYMITYANYYGITEETDKARCDVIVEKVLEPMMRELAGDEDLKLVDFSALAAKYLMSCGMTEEQVLALVEKL